MFKGIKYKFYYLRHTLLLSVTKAKHIIKYNIYMETLQLIHHDALPVNLYNKYFGITDCRRFVLYYKS